jgi:mono/diheme cytochrome c family protein
MRLMAARLVALLVVALALPAKAAFGQSSPSRRASAVDYVRQVKPILTRHCVECHGEEKPRGGLRLDTAAAALAGGKGGPAVLPGRGEESPLIEAVRGEGTIARMPLKRPPLSDAEISLLLAWIDQGATSPAGELPGVLGKRRHWAFIPPQRPAVPEVRRSAWARNPIDRFVLSRLEQAGLSPSPEADGLTLLRRLNLDLIGLPPSTEEIASFLAGGGAAPDRTIDRLIASPQFGERWARPWLDQARYADSNGYNIDAPRAIWKYRDWVIAALNADMPFDEFAVDQLAGDLRSGASFGPRIATGFHRNTQINQEGGIDVEQFRIESIVDRVNTTGTVFLGLTIGCAQCHDHKYDPISQRDYYQLFAFFNNVDEPELEVAAPAELARRDQIRSQIQQFHRELVARYPDLDERERRWEATVTLDFKQAQDADARVALDAPREKRTTTQRRALVELMLAGDRTFRAEYAKLSQLRAAEPHLVTSLVVKERAGKPRETFVHVGGDFTRKGARVEPAVPAVLPGLPGSRSGAHRDRMDLARWLVDGRNPLTARVQVNRIWQAYFGRGLVETDNDFGTQGTRPAHPELLDWLACELVDNGWSLKAIHRLIVGSATYRQSSRTSAPGQAIDPANRLLWRQARLRLDAELIRDSALAASGLLSGRIGGPSVFPPQPDGVMTLGQMKRPWRADTGPNRYRRGLYTYLWRATPYPFLTTFDAPGGVQSCTRRFRSNTPLQALTLLNDPAFVEIAEGLAARIVNECPGPASDSQRLAHAFRLCLGREPTAREQNLLLAVLDRERTERDDAASSHSAAKVGDLAHCQPWVTVARVLLNLDEFVTRE